jgi:hypothetical protein
MERAFRKTVAKCVGYATLATFFVIILVGAYYLGK